MERILHDIMTENTELKQLLTRKEAELTRAEETIMREKQQIQEIVSLMTCSWVVECHSLYIITGTQYQERAATDSGDGEHCDIPWIYMYIVYLIYIGKDPNSSYSAMCLCLCISKHIHYFCSEVITHIYTLLCIPVFELVCFAYVILLVIVGKDYQERAAAE